MVLIKKKKEQSKEELEQDEQAQALKKAGLQDQFQAKGFEVIAFLQKHRTSALAFMGVLACASLSYLGWTLLVDTSNEKASAQYEAALHLLENRSIKDDLKKKAVQDALLKIVQEHKRSDVAKLANLHAAHLSFELNDPQNAIRIYRSFLQETRQKDALRPLALTGLGYAYEANHDIDMALKTFEEMITLQVNINTDNALWEIARLAKEKGLNDKARENAEILLKRYPDSILVSSAQMLLSSLPPQKAITK